MDSIITSLFIFALMKAMISAVPIELHQYQQLPDSVVIPFNGNRVATAGFDGIRVLDIGYGRPAAGSKNSVSVGDEAVVTISPFVVDGQQSIVTIDGVQMSRDAFNQRQHTNIEAGTLSMVLEVSITEAGTRNQGEVSDTIGTPQTDVLTTFDGSKLSSSSMHTGIAVETATRAADAISTGTASGHAIGSPSGFAIGTIIGSTAESTTRTATTNSLKKSAELSTDELNTVTFPSNIASGIEPETNTHTIDTPIVSGTTNNEKPQIPHHQYGIPSIPQARNFISTNPMTTTFIKDSNADNSMVSSPSSSLTSINSLLGTTIVPRQAIIAKTNNERMQAIVIPIHSDELHSTYAVPSTKRITAANANGDIRYVLNDETYQYISKDGVLVFIFRF